MAPAQVRGQGVVSTDTRAPAAMDELEALYRSGRDDVFAYATTLLRDRAASGHLRRLGVAAPAPRMAFARPTRLTTAEWPPV